MTTAFPQRRALLRLRVPPTVYFRVGGWIVWSALRLLRAGLIGKRGMLVALGCYRLISRAGMRAWRAERRRRLDPGWERSELTAGSVRRGPAAAQDAGPGGGAT